MKKSNSPLSAAEFIFALLFSLACGAVLLLPLFFSSCSNINASEAKMQAKDYTPSQSQGGVAAEPCVSNPRTLTILINGFGADNQNSSQSKTILPKERIAIGDLTFVLKAIPSGGDVLHSVLSGASPAPASGLQYSVVVPAGLYSFYLYAFKSADIEAAAISPGPGVNLGEAILDASDIMGASRVTAAFYGTAPALDLSEGQSANVSFNLSPIGLSGYGKVQLGGAYVDEGAAVHGIRIGLYDIQTQQTVYGRNSLPSLNLSPCFKEMRISTPQASSAVAPSYFGSTASQDSPIPGANIANQGTSGIIPVNGSMVFNVPGGSYLAAVTFYADTACSLQIGYWADIVIVEPTNVSDNRDIFFRGIHN